MNKQQRHTPCHSVARRAGMAGRIVGLVCVTALAGSLSIANAAGVNSGGANTGGTGTVLSPLPAPQLSLAGDPNATSLTFAGGVFSNFQFSTSLPYVFPQGVPPTMDGAAINIDVLNSSADQVTLRFTEATPVASAVPFDYLRNLTFQTNFVATGVSLNATGFSATVDESGFAGVAAFDSTGFTRLADLGSINVNANQQIKSPGPVLASGLPSSLYDIEWYLVNGHQNQGGTGTFTSLDATFTVSAVPEPATNAMMALGLFLLGGLSLKKRRS